MASEVDRMEAELVGAFRVATDEGVAACVRNLARAIAREEIERAKPSDKPPTVAPVSGEPGGVRVARYGHDGKLRVEVGRETLANVLTEFFGWKTPSRPSLEMIATRLGLTLTNGGTDE